LNSIWLLAETGSARPQKPCRTTNTRTLPCPKAVLFHLNDPSGLDLERAWREELDNFGVAIEDFVRISLNRDQLGGLPERLASGIEVKPSDSRSARYVELYGDRCWEADILPASILSPGQKGKLP